jgi:peptidoglycan/LPS O-acetylase OafA/YrhL
VWLVLAGQRSYSHYLWHFPLVLVARRSLPDSLLTIPLLLVASWLLASLSWRYVEQATQRWRKVGRVGLEPTTQGL